MTQSNKSSYLAGAAIAAALASVATPAIAQDITAAPIQSVAPPDLSEILDQQEPAATTSEAPPMAPAASPARTNSAAAGSEASDVPVNPQALAQAAAEDAAKAQSRAQAAPKRAVAASAPAASIPTPSQSVDAMPEADTQTPVAPIAVPEADLAPAPATTPAPVAERSATEQTVSADTPALLWIGLAGAAVVIAGLAAAMLLRRRRDTEVTDDVVVETPVAEGRPEAVEQVVPPVADSGPAVERPRYIPSRSASAATAPTVASANGAMGRHEIAARRGPTSDNPFATLSKRLARARFYDRQERLAAEAEGRPADMPWTTRDRSDAASPTAGEAAKRPVRNGGRAFNWSNGGWKPAFDG